MDAVILIKVLVALAALAIPVGGYVWILVQLRDGSHDLAEPDPLFSVDLHNQK